MHTITKTQDQFVKDNDREGWLRQLHIENGGRGLNLPYQYKYIHEDMDVAIELIQNDANPQAYALLTECYEVSLRLLTQNFVGFAKVDVDEFMASEDYSTNHIRELDNEKPDENTLTSIHKQAKVWFADDFKFYKAAIKQFVDKMKNPGLPESVLETCPNWSEASNATEA